LCIHWADIALGDALYTCQYKEQSLKSLPGQGEDITVYSGTDRIKVKNMKYKTQKFKELETTQDY
jgi:hypothetical protein